MLTSPRAFGAAVLCLAGLAAHAPALADQWRIEHATVIELDDGVGEPSASPLRLDFSTLAEPFQDGQYPKSSPWSDYYQPVISTKDPRYGEWQLMFKPDNGAAPSVDLANMRASFASLELDQVFVISGERGGSDSYWVRPMYTLGLSDPVKLKALGDGRYHASWDVHARLPGLPEYDLGLYAVSLTFTQFSEGTPPVPEPSSAFMALAGIGAVAWARKRPSPRSAQPHRSGTALSARSGRHVSRLRT